MTPMKMIAFLVEKTETISCTTKLQLETNSTMTSFLLAASKVSYKMSIRSVPSTRNASSSLTSQSVETSLLKRMSSVTVVQYKLVPSHAVSHKEDQNVSASVSLVKHAVPVKVSLEVDGDMQPAHITIFTVTCEARVKEISE